MLPGIKLFDLSGKTAVITGGSKGLGEAMAASLASAGANLMLVSRNEAEAKATAARVAEEFGCQALGYSADVSSQAEMEAMASALPVVAADAVALPHLVHHGENGYLFTPGDVDELAARLTDVLTADADERRRMQQASLDGVAVHDINRTLDTFEALYRGEPLPE